MKLSHRLSEGLTTSKSLSTIAERIEDRRNEKSDEQKSPTIVIEKDGIKLSIWAPTCEKLIEYASTWQLMNWNWSDCPVVVALGLNARLASGPTCAGAGGKASVFVPSGLIGVIQPSSENKKEETKKKGNQRKNAWCVFDNKMPQICTTESCPNHCVWCSWVNFSLFSNN